MGFRIQGLLLLVGSVCACADDRTLSDASGAADVGPTPDGGGITGTFDAQPVDRLAPTVRITAPADGARVDGPELIVEGVADDDVGLATVFVKIGANVAVLAESRDGYRTWSVALPVPVGGAAIEATAYDASGRRSAASLIRISNPPPSDSQPPTVSITSPNDGFAARSATVLLRGEAGDDVEVVRMELERNGERLVDRAIETEDFFRTWVRPVLLLPGQDNALVVRAYDAFGRSGEATVRVFGQPQVDREPPALSLAEPQSDLTSVETDVLPVTGSATDRIGVREVKARIGRRIDDRIRFGPSTLATSRDGFANFELQLPIPVGPFILEVKAIDVSGLATSVRRELVNTRVEPWSEPQPIPLFLRDNDPVASVTLDLDRDGVNEVIVPSIQRTLTLFDLDPVPPLRDLLDQIKSACGTAWRLDNPDPNHNCSLTPLGQTFVGPDGRWQTSSEYSLVRILTLTPANVVVEGTSVAGLQGLADFLRLGGGFRQILADLLGIERTAEIVNTAALAEALRTGLLAPHPATTVDGAMPITLYDVMNDLAPLGQTFGPVPGHPGVVDPATIPRGEVFGADFLISIVAQSNLRWLDGVDLDQGKEYISIVVDTEGPTLNDVLEFDFNDPGRFGIAGLVSEPTLDLRVTFSENPTFVDACSGDPVCQSNLPATPRPGFIWTTPTWEIEHTVAAGALNQYAGRRVSLCPGNCLLSRIEMGANGDPAGWTEFTVLFNLGNPPQSQYVWELINEVAQVALHNPPSGRIAEGAANVGFTLRDVRVGMTADDIRRVTRPSLQAQSSMLSERLLGDFARNNGRVDFFYRRGADGVPYVFFVSPDDPRPGEPYAFERPGFFAEPSLTTRVSETDIPGSGDDTHQKLRLMSGETVVYAADELAQVYRLRFVASDDDDVVVWVSRRVQ